MWLPTNVLLVIVNMYKYTELCIGILMNCLIIIRMHITHDIHVLYASLICIRTTGFGYPLLKHCQHISVAMKPYEGRESEVHFIFPLSGTHKIIEMISLCQKMVTEIDLWKHWGGTKKKTFPHILGILVPIYRVFLKKGNRSSKVSHLKNTTFHTT